MSPQDLPFDVLAFLQERIGGIDDLEALLLVRSDLSRDWTASSVAASLALSESWAGPALEGLCAAQLLEETGAGGEERRFRYRPATPALGSVVTLLAEIYDERRTDILRLLNENAVDRIRAAAARTFGGAFENRQNKDGRKRNGRKKNGKKNGGRKEDALQPGKRDRGRGGGGDR